MGPSSLAYLERSLLSLAGCGLAESERLQTVAMMTAIASAFVQNEVSADTVMGRGGEVPDRLRYLGQVANSGKYPHLA